MNHVCRLGDDCGLACHAREGGSRRRVLPCNRMRVRLPNDRPFFGEHLCKCLPVVCIQEAVFALWYFVRQSWEGCRLTTTESPGTRAPWAMLHGVHPPDFLFFAWRQCHMASKAITGLFSAMTGASLVSAIGRIQAYVGVRDTPKSVASNPQEDVPSEYQLTRKAFVSAVAWWCRSSPRTK